MHPHTPMYPHACTIHQVLTNQWQGLATRQFNIQTSYYLKLLCYPTLYSVRAMGTFGTRTLHSCLDAAATAAFTLPRPLQILDVPVHKSSRMIKTLPMWVLTSLYLYLPGSIYKIPDAQLFTCFHLITPQGNLPNTKPTTYQQSEYYWIACAGYQSNFPTLIESENTYGWAFGLPMGAMRSFIILHCQFFIALPLLPWYFIMGKHIWRVTGSRDGP